MVVQDIEVDREVEVDQEVNMNCLGTGYLSEHNEKLWFTGAGKGRFFDRGVKGILHGIKGRDGFRPQKKGIVSKNKLLEGKGNFITFIEKYEEEPYRSRKKYKNFSDACHFISTNGIISRTIANFVNEGAQLLKQKGAFNETDVNIFKQIAKKIGQLIVNVKIKLDTFNSIDIANTFNGLAQCGVNLGEYLNKPENEELKNAFIGALVDRTQTLLPDFNSIDIANTFNGLAQCGVDLGEYFETEEDKKLKNVFIGALVGKIQALLSEFNSIGIANTFNGLVKLFLYNEDLYKKNIGQFKDIMNILVNKYFELLDRDDQSDRTILYNIKYLQACNFEFSKEILSKIPPLELDALDDDHINSALETNFGTFLSDTLKLKNKTTKTAETKDDCYEQESKLTFQVGSASFQRSTDFCIEFTHDGKKYKTYIELDGPSHFENTEQTQKTPRTQIRDILTLQRLQEEQETLSEKGDQTQILYVTLSANKFDEIKTIMTTKEQLFYFLIQRNQLKSTPERTSDSSEMTDEDKGMPPLPTEPYPTPTPPPPPPAEPYPIPSPPPPPPTEPYPDGGSSKMTDTDNYATPTSKPAVSQNAQQGQQEQQLKETQQAQKRTREEKGDDPLRLGAMYGFSDDKSMKQKAEQGTEQPASKKPRQVVGNAIPCP